MKHWKSLMATHPLTKVDLFDFMFLNCWKSPNYPEKNFYTDRGQVNPEPGLLYATNCHFSRAIKAHTITKIFFNDTDAVVLLTTVRIYYNVISFENLLIFRKSQRRPSMPLFVSTAE